MTLRDFIVTSTGNLWRMKLRAFLTIGGVVIAIAAFVAMVSFGAGIQQNVRNQFDELGLFSTIQVYPPKDGTTADSNKTAVLNEAAIEQLSQIPGVELAYPFDRFSVTATVADTQIKTNAQALPTTAVRTKLFSRMLAGSAFTEDDTREALVTKEFLEKLGIDEPDSIIGAQLVISVDLSSIDSGLAHVFQDPDSSVRGRLQSLRADSVLNTDYLQRFADVRLDTLSRQGFLRWLARQGISALADPDYRRRLASLQLDSLVKIGNLERIGRKELDAAMKRFLDGYMRARAVICDTLTIGGVIRGTRGRRSGVEPILISTATALRLNTGGLSNDPAAMFAALSEGTLPSPFADTTGKTYPRVTVKLAPGVLYQTVSDSVKALGYRTFSFAEQFKEIQRFTFYFNVALSAVGLIALITAALGIVNTMVMSILQRTREIGVLKSLGADERDIRRLFLAESGMIGSIGAVFGILFGWLITRLASVIAHIVMERQGIEEVELFALPVWLVLTAFLFGLIVSLLAGFYPASRAARIDPVAALRND